MIWFLITCGIYYNGNTCTWSPPLKSAEQCAFVREYVDNTSLRRTVCVGLRK